MTTRRAIITGIGLSPAFAIPAVAAIIETPEDRLVRLTKEIIEAAEAVYPSIDGWTAVVGSAGHGIIIHGMSHGMVRSKAPKPDELFYYSSSPESRP